MLIFQNKLENKEYLRLKEFTDDIFLLWSNMCDFYPEKSFIHKQAKTMEEFMIHLIRNEGVFDLFLNDDERKENEKLKRKNSKDDPNEIKIPKKRGRKPRNFLDPQKVINKSSSNTIGSDSRNYFGNQNKYKNIKNNIITNFNTNFERRMNYTDNRFAPAFHFSNHVMMNIEPKCLINENLFNNFQEKENNNEQEKNQDADICVEI